MLFYRSLLDIFRKEIQQTLDNHIKKVLANVPNTLEAPLIIRFDLNYKHLSMIDGMKDILQEILDEPLQSIKDIREAAWAYIFYLLVENYPESKIGFQLRQIHCIIRFADLPLNRHFEFIPYRHPVRLSLSVMKCVLHSFGDQSAYVRQSIWYCPKKCPNNQNYIIDGEYTTDNNCSECNGNLSEYKVRIYRCEWNTHIKIYRIKEIHHYQNKIVNYCTQSYPFFKCVAIFFFFVQHRRSTYNCRLIRVFNAESLETPNRFWKISRDIQVKLSDELCDAVMVLGQIYVLIGTYDILSQIYIAWHFQPFNV